MNLNPRQKDCIGISAAGSQACSVDFSLGRLFSHCIITICETASLQNPWAGQGQTHSPHTHTISLSHTHNHTTQSHTNKPHIQTHHTHQKQWPKCTPTTTPLWSSPPGVLPEGLIRTIYTLCRYSTICLHNAFCGSKLLIGSLFIRSLLKLRIFNELLYNSTSSQRMWGFSHTHKIGRASCRERV